MNKAASLTTAAGLRKDIDEIDEALKQMYTIKMNGIINLEEMKLLLRKVCNPRLFRKKINVVPLPSCHGYTKIHHLDNILALMDREISFIQNKHDELSCDLHDLKKDMQEKILKVEKSCVGANMLNYKKYEAQFELKMQLQELLRNKLLLKRKYKQGNPQLAVELKEIDNAISELENNCLEQIESVNDELQYVEKENKNCFYIQEKKKRIMEKHHKDLKLLLDFTKVNIQNEDCCKSQLQQILNSSEMLKIDDLKNLGSSKNLLLLYKQLCDMLLLKYYNFV